MVAQTLLPAHFYVVALACLTPSLGVIFWALIVSGICWRCNGDGVLKEAEGATVLVKVRCPRCGGSGDKRRWRWR